MDQIQPRMEITQIKEDVLVSKNTTAYFTINKYFDLFQNFLSIAAVV